MTVFRYISGLIKSCNPDLLIAGIVLVGISLGLALDANSTPTEQLLLGLVAWPILVAFLFREQSQVRFQIAVAVMFATIGEHFASPYLGAYIYRFENVPAYVPPGHGMVYLAALALARSELFDRHRSFVTGTALLIGAVWSLWGVMLAARPDAAGALLFCLFSLFVFFGRSPLIYVAAFFITSYLEIVGTWFGTWAWALNEPVSGFSQANPPSGIAFWYCLVDAAALSGGILLARAFASIKLFVSSPFIEQSSKVQSEAERP